MEQSYKTHTLDKALIKISEEWGTEFDSASWDIQGSDATRLNP